MIAVLAALLVAGATAFATRRYPPPAWTFVGHERYPAVVVVTDDAAPRRGDRVLDFSEHCAVVVHPDDLDRAREHGPWSIYAGAFPLPQTDVAIGAVAFATGATGPSPLGGAEVNRAMTSCAGPEARAAWQPPTLEVRGATSVWLVQRMGEVEPGRGPREIDAAGQCAVVVDGLPLDELQVVFVDASGAPLPNHDLGAAGVEVAPPLAAVRFLAVPTSTPPQAVAELAVGGSAAWAACLEQSPELRAIWTAP